MSPPLMFRIVCCLYRIIIFVMALRGIKVVEMMGLAPGPFCGTILADHGASVTVVQKIGVSPVDVMSNGKKVLSVNLKSKEGVDIVRRLCSSSDVLLDTFRPGVMEKLGLGPDFLIKENSRLVYARLTGYGQTGTYKHKAGHDINYVAMSGVLSMLGNDKNPPKPPINLLADFAGGSVLCALAIMMALFERTNSGKGQIIDCSMTEGVAYLATWLFRSRNLPIWVGEPGTNVLDGGFPCYATYKTKDNKYMAVGALEPQFYSRFLEGLQLSEDEYGQTCDLEHCKLKFQEIFLTKSQKEWCSIFDDIDACVTPVLDFSTADDHEFHKSRYSFYKDNDNNIMPESAPRLSCSPSTSSGKQYMPQPGQHTIEILTELGFTKKDISKMIDQGHVYGVLKSNL